MKRKNIRILYIIALAAGIAAGASTVSAAGQVGQRYLQGTLDGVFWDGDSGLDDGLGGTLIYNQPLAKTFDLGLGYSHLGSDLPDIDDGMGGEIDGGSLTGDAFFFTGTWFTPAANGKLYFRGGLGWVNTDTPVGEDSSWAWTAETGLEILLGDRLAVTPYIAYTDAFEGNTDGTFDFGVTGTIDITSRLSLLLAASINDDSDLGARGGVVFRF